MKDAGAGARGSGEAGNPTADGVFREGFPGDTTPDRHRGRKTVKVCEEREQQHEGPVVAGGSRSGAGTAKGAGVGTGGRPRGAGHTRPWGWGRPLDLTLSVMGSRVWAGPDGGFGETWPVKTWHQEPHLEAFSTGQEMEAGRVGQEYWTGN